ncbi:hypothetical protein AMTR_s00085p00091850, partial [Amborella trichopoda]
IVSWGIEHIFKADLPGLKKEEVKVVVVEGRLLQIGGEGNKEEEKNEKWHRVEKSRGKFLRGLWLKVIVLIPKAVNQIPTTSQAVRKKCKERELLKLAIGNVML